MSDADLEEIEASAGRIAKFMMDAVDRARPLCPDHRDKQHGKTCLACRIEQLEKALAFYADRENWRSSHSTGPDLRVLRQSSRFDNGWEVAERALKGASQ